jgi:alkylation response protein AidB-like acyl-CoA dehydrogenase
MWRQYAEMGLLALPFPEADGGLAGGPADTMIVMEALGKCLALEPYFTTIVLGAGVLRSGADAQQRRRFVDRICDGTLLLAVAYLEEQSRWDPCDVATTARRSGNGWVLDGRKTLVLHGDTADWLIVTARASGNRRDCGGIGLFLVPAGSQGVARISHANQDDTRAAEILLREVRVPDEDVLGDPGIAIPLLDEMIDRGIAALCAEAVGAMTVAHETTVEYLKVRRQFGVQIGTFQALQHRAADMLIALEKARGMALYATLMVDEADPLRRRTAMSAAKVQIGKSGRFVGQQAVQLHGGIGWTYECNISHYFKRLTMLDILFGHADEHLARVAEGPGLMAVHA